MISNARRGGGTSPRRVIIEHTARVEKSRWRVELRLGAAIAGLGVVSSFEDFLAPAMRSGQLEPVLEDWWQSFPGPFLYYASRRHMPAPLRAFVDFLKVQPG